jgi:hypothetical protein
VYRNGTQVATQTNLRITAGNFRRVTLAWLTAGNTTVEGNYNVTVYVSPVTDEVTTANNMQNVTVLMKLLPVAYFSFSPASPQISEVVQFDASPSCACRVDHRLSLGFRRRRHWYRSHCDSRFHSASILVCEAHSC